jgi:ankyrin repeat protein
MKPEDINRLNDIGETLLHGAVRFGDVNIVRLLLEAGADTYIKDKEGRLPVFWVCANYNAKFDNILTILLDYTDDFDYPDNAGETLLQVAERIALHLAVEKGADVSAKVIGGWTALHLAAERGHEAVVKLLVEKAEGWIALHLAVKREDEAAVRLLVELGADINARDPGFDVQELRALEGD